MPIRSTGRWRRATAASRVFTWMGARMPYCRTSRWLGLATLTGMALLMAACTKAADTSDAGSPPMGGTGTMNKPRAGNGAAGTAGKAPHDAGASSDGGGFFDDDGGVLTNKQLFEGVPFDAVKST